MEDSFEIDTIKETNEEHFADNDENIDAYKVGKRYVSGKSSKASNQRGQIEERNVFRDRTNKGYDNKSSKGKISQDALKNNKRPSHKGHRGGDEEVLSSLSGFSGSDNEEQDVKMKHTPIPRSQYDDEEEEDEEDEEFEGQLVNKAEDLQSRFKYYDDLRKKVEEERKLAKYEKENQEVGRSQKILQRPQSSHGNQDIRRSYNNIKPFEGQNNVPTRRPQTSAGIQYVDEENGENVLFKPLYTKPISQDLIERKIFNYSDKRFKTIPRKNDPVSRINAFKNEWKKSKFLTSNSSMKEGRKLDLATRNAHFVTSKKY